MEKSAKTVGGVNAKAVKPDGWLKMIFSICLSIYSDATIAEIMDYVLSSLGRLAVPVPSIDQCKTFLNLSENHTIGLKSWRIAHLRKNYAWDESTMGKLFLCFIYFLTNFIL